MRYSQCLFVGVALWVAVAAGGPEASAGRFRGSRDEWGRGHWVHDRYHGRLGWWWVVGPQWTYYPRPHSFVIETGPPPDTVVVQQAPPVAPPVIVQQAPPPAPVAVAPPTTPVLYYCKATGTHYPETMSCPGGWSTMTADTPPVPVTGP